MQLHVCQLNRRQAQDGYKRCSIVFNWLKMVQCYVQAHSRMLMLLSLRFTSLRFNLFAWCCCHVVVDLKAFANVFTLVPNLNQDL